MKKKLEIHTLPDDPIDQWVKKGDKRPKGQLMVKLQVNLPEDVHTELHIRARKQRRAAAHIVRELVENYLKT